MSSRDFRGFRSIQEVECWGGKLTSDVRLISLLLVRLPDSVTLASLNVITENCMTYSEFSSCVIESQDTHRSKVRVLVHDLQEGESRMYACSATTVTPQGKAVETQWTLRVFRSSKCGQAKIFIFSLFLFYIVSNI
jgi:hypothetical protein